MSEARRLAHTLTRSLRRARELADRAQIRSFRAMTRRAEARAYLDAHTAADLRARADDDADQLGRLGCSRTARAAMLRA